MKANSTKSIVMGLIVGLIIGLAVGYIIMEQEIISARAKLRLGKHN